MAFLNFVLPTVFLLSQYNISKFITYNVIQLNYILLKDF